MTLVMGDSFDDVNDDVVVPNNAAQAFPIGTRIRLLNRSGGQVTISDGGSVVWEGQDLSAVDLPDDAECEILKVATDTWKIVHYEARGTHTSDVAGYAADPSIAFTYSRSGQIVSIRFTQNSYCSSLSPLVP